MKTKLLMGLALTLLTAGCEIAKTEYSDVMKEDATVADTFFVPSSHSVSVWPDGQGGFSIDSDTEPQKFGVLFQCKHGKFVIQGSSQRYAALWKKMTVGHPVTITYREIYKVTEKEGKKFHDYDFIDAEPLKLGEL